jgi:ABC-type sugar transport system substrate-binding protein
MTAYDGKIGLFLLSRENSHQLASQRAAEEAAARHGVPIEVSFADNLAVQQAQNIVQFIHANSKVRTCVILMPMADIESSSDSLDTHPLHRLARRVAARGMGWVILNRDGRGQVAALQREFPRVPVALISPDQYEFGRVQGRQFRALLPRGGRILYVLGDTGASSARDRRKGMREIVGGDAAFTIEEVDGLWSRKEAREAVAKWLSHASRRGDWPDLIGGQNDAMAMGAREALADAARLHSTPALLGVPVTGGDGLPDEGQKWVSERKLAATVVAPLTTAVAVDSVVRSWRTATPMPLLTQLEVSSLPAIEQLRPAIRPPQIA